MRFLYTGLMIVAYGLLRVIALFHERLKLNFLLRSNLPDFSAARGKTHIWFHAASAGEFEQVRAIALAMRKTKGDFFFSFSYSSDSAYKAKKNDRVPDLFFALPFDFPWRMRKLVSLMHPQALIIGKYDAWPNQVAAAYAKQIPVFLASATLPEKSLRHRVPWKWFLRTTYSGMQRIFAINEEHAQRLRKISGGNVTSIGDTRFDAIDIRLKESRDLGALKKNLSRRVIVAGSTYDTSEKMIFEFLQTNREFCAVVAPHHVNETRLQQIEARAEAMNLSVSRVNAARKSRVIIVDSLGILPHLYALGEVAYVGGGFQGSVHSVIEAAAHGVAIITGPHISNSAEAVDLERLGLLRVGATPDGASFGVLVENLSKNRQKKSQEIRRYFRERLGVSDKIVHTVMDDLKRIQ